jgi:DNA-binding transcriptional regulator LsrR (DeoR family)
MISDDLLYKVAMEYYIRKKSQRAIADEVGVSRVQISKYLVMAEKREIVRFVVSMPGVSEDESRGYKKFFKEEFGLKELLITPGAGNAERLYELLANDAMEYLLNTIPNKPLTLGLGWGDTLYHVSRTKFAGAEKKTKWLVVPLSGGIAELNDRVFNINIIIQSFAENVGASYQSMYIPFMHDAKYMHQMMNENELYKQMVRYWDSLDVMVVSIGYFDARSPIFRETDKYQQEHFEMVRRGIIGDIQSHFFTKEGENVEYNFEKDIFNISLEQIRKVKKKIFIAGGLHKVDSIIGALRMKNMVDVLVADKVTVKNVIAYLGEDVQ